MNPEIRAGLEERAKYYISLENFVNYFTREEGRCHEHGLVKHTVVGSRENQEVLAFYLSECIDKAVYGDLSAHNLGILVQNIRDGLRTATMKQNTFQPDGRLDPWTKFLAFVGVCYPWFGENKISLCNAFIPNHPYVIHMAIQRFLQQERSARGRTEPNRPTALANSAVANGNSQRNGASYTAEPNGPTTLANSAVANENSQRNGASYTAEPNGPTALANSAVANGNSQRNGASYSSGDGSAPAAAEENLSEEEKKRRHELALKDKDLALKDKDAAESEKARKHESAMKEKDLESLKVKKEMKDKEYTHESAMKDKEYTHESAMKDKEKEMKVLQLAENDPDTYFAMKDKDHAHESAMKDKAKEMKLLQLAEKDPEKYLPLAQQLLSPQSQFRGQSAAATPAQMGAPGLVPPSTTTVPSMTTPSGRAALSGSRLFSYTPAPTPAVAGAKTPCGAKALKVSGYVLIGRLVTSKPFEKIGNKDILRVGELQGCEDGKNFQKNKNWKTRAQICDGYQSMNFCCGCAKSAMIYLVDRRDITRDDKKSEIHVYVKNENSTHKNGQKIWPKQRPFKNELQA